MTEEMIDMIDCDTSAQDLAEMRADYLQRELDELADKYELEVRQNVEFKQQLIQLDSELRFERDNHSQTRERLTAVEFVNARMAEEAECHHIQEQMESDVYEDCPF